MTGMLTDYPHLVEQWHPTKNANLVLTNITAGSDKKIWWICIAGHEWQAPTKTRAKSNSSCQFCSGKRVYPGFNDFLTQFPHLEQEWHPAKNGTVNPRTIAKTSQKKFWWISPKCGHEWEASVNNRANCGTDCPFCTNTRVLSGFNDLASKKPNLAAEWHPTKNAFLPSEIAGETHDSYWWICRSQHEWKAQVNQRFHGKSNCPVCTSEARNQNSVASNMPHLIEEWHTKKNQGIDPSELTIGSDKKVWWIGKCNHEWSSPLNWRTLRKQGCPYCAGRRVLKDFNSVGHLYPEYLKEWHPTKNEGISLFKLTVGSHKKVWWVCSKGHEWETVLRYRTLQKSGCPQCYAARTVSLVEQELYDYLVKATGLDIKQSDRTVLKPLELDMYIPAKRLAIEFNGVYWHSEANGKGKTYHQNKWLACQALGIELLQVWCEDYEQKPDVVRTMILRKLGFAASGEPVVSVAMDAKDVRFVEVSEAAAKAYFSKTSFSRFESAEKHFGVRFSGSKKLVGLLSVDHHDDELDVIQFATTVPGYQVLDVLLAHALSALDVKTVKARLDNCFADFDGFVACGFAVQDVLPADFVYLRSGNRIGKSEYDVERFRTDPKLQFIEGKSVDELADVNGLNRLWDAGCSVMVKTVA